MQAPPLLGDVAQQSRLSMLLSRSHSSTFGLSLSGRNLQVLKDNGFAEELDQSHLLPVPGTAPPPPKASAAAVVQIHPPSSEPNRQTATPGSGSVKQQIYMVSQHSHVGICSTAQIHGQHQWTSPNPPGTLP